MVNAERASTGFVVASGGGLSEGSGRWPDGGLSEGYGHDEPGVCLGDSLTEAYLSEEYGHGGPGVCLGDGQTGLFEG